MEKNEIENNGIRRDLLRSGLASLLLMMLFTLSSCGDEKEIGQEPLSEGYVPVTLSMVTTKGESSSDEIRESKMYIYCQGPDENRYTLAKIIDFAGKGTQVVEFKKEDLTAGHLYRFLSYVSFSDHEHYKDDENWEDELIRSSWHYLDGDELKDLDDGIGKSSWEDIRLYSYDKSNSHYYDKEYVQFDYYNASKSNGLQIMQDQKIEATLTGMRGQFVVDFFKSPDGTFSNAEATSDGKSILFLNEEMNMHINSNYYNGYSYPTYIPTYDYFLFDGMELNPDLELSSVRYTTFNAFHRWLTVAMLKGEESYPHWLVPGAQEGSVRFYSPLLPPGVYDLSMSFFASKKLDGSFENRLNLTISEVSILPGTRTVIRVASPTDRVWEGSSAFEFDILYPNAFPVGVGR